MGRNDLMEAGQTFTSDANSCLFSRRVADVALQGKERFLNMYLWLSMVTPTKKKLCSCALGQCVSGLSSGVFSARVRERLQM